MSIIGAILGDIAGSQIEFSRSSDFNFKTSPLFTDKCRVTDDTIMTLATKLAFQQHIPFRDAYQILGRKYLEVGYGGLFKRWIQDDDPKPYNSFGNGAAMRVSPIIDYARSLEECRELAYYSASCTHNHSEGLKSAVAIAELSWMARHGASKTEIKKYAYNYYPPNIYDIDKPLDYHIKNHLWNCVASSTVPLAIRCVLDANSYEEFIRNVFSVNCDSDTVCAIGGCIADELFGGIGFDCHHVIDRYLDEFQKNIFYENAINLLTYKDKSDIIGS